MNEGQKCPICGGPAESGYLCAPTEGLALRWIEGEPSAIKSFGAIFGGTPRVGKTGLTHGSHVTGIRCSSCKKIVVEDETKTSGAGSQ